MLRNRDKHLYSSIPSRILVFQAQVQVRGFQVYPGGGRDSDVVRRLLANVDETDRAKFLNGDRKL